MKKIITILLVVFVMSASVLFGFDSGELNSIQFQNSTGFDIEYLFLSPGDSEYWGPEILGSSRILSDGDSLGFYIHYPDSCNDFDIMAIDEMGDAFIVYNYTICDGESAYIELELEDVLDEPPELEYVTLEINNETDYDMWYVFLSPSDSNMWGTDLLDETTILYSGDSFEILIPATKSVVDFDFMGVDEDEDEYQFTVTINKGKKDSLYVDIEPDDYTGN